MIFVTVGTHEQGMDRLLIELDKLIENKLIECEIVAQIGYSDYKPKNYKYKELIGYDEMDELVKKADIVITHGGPGSIFHAIHYKKAPIVVPRNPMYNEHVDDHQILFCKRLATNKRIIPVYEIEELGNCILDYNKLASTCRDNNKNNEFFIQKFENLINQMIKIGN